MKTKLWVILSVTVVLLLSISIGVVHFVSSPEDVSTPVDTSEVDKPLDTTPPQESIHVPVLIGNTELSEERSALLEEGILAEIERLCTGTPKEDENGNFIADEHGVLVYEANCDVDYTEMKNNLAILINHFADRGYSNEAIFQIQRYYFHYARSFAKYEVEDILDKLELCFPKSGTTPMDLTKNAAEVFGHKREDGFPFVFEPPVEVADIKVVFFAVKAWGDTYLTDEQEALCIFSEWESGNENERNLEGWLHKIIREMSAFGYGEKEILVAQLLYAGSLAETEYRYDLIESLRLCIGLEQECTMEELKIAAQNTFDVNIEENVSLMDYMEGKTAYHAGGMK